MDMHNSKEAVQQNHKTRQSCCQKMELNKTAVFSVALPMFGFVKKGMFLKGREVPFSLLPRNRSFRNKLRKTFDSSCQAVPILRKKRIYVY